MSEEGRTLKRRRSDDGEAEEEAGGSSPAPDVVGADAPPPAIEPVPEAEAHAVVEQEQEGAQAPEPTEAPTVAEAQDAEQDAAAAEAQAAQDVQAAVAAQAQAQAQAHAEAIAAQHAPIVEAPRPAVMAAAAQSVQQQMSVQQQQVHQQQQAAYLLSQQLTQQQQLQLLQAQILAQQQAAQHQAMLAQQQQQMQRAEYKHDPYADLDYKNAGYGMDEIKAKPKPSGQQRKSAPAGMYDPQAAMTASGRPARARRVNYAELAGAMEDEEEDDQANLVPNWARRRKKGGDQDRDYGVGIGSSRGSAGAGGAYGMNSGAYARGNPQVSAANAGLQGWNQSAAVQAAARTAGVAGLGNAGLAGLAGNAALAGQAVGWQNQVAWNQNAGLANPYAAALAAQARPQAAAQPYVLQGAPRAMTGLEMGLMLGRTDGQGGMPGQQR